MILFVKVIHPDASVKGRTVKVNDVTVSWDKNHVHVGFVLNGMYEKMDMKADEPDGTRLETELWCIDDTESIVGRWKVEDGMIVEVTSP